MKLLEDAGHVWDRFTGKESAVLIQKLNEAEGNERLLQESMVELQLALEDRDWQKLSMDYDTEFTPDNIRRIMKVARVFRLKNPLIKCAVELQANYVFGKGLKVSSPDEAVEKELKVFLEDNKAELGVLGLWEKECTLRTDGNLYFVLFDDNSTGAVKVRTVEPLEITEKFCNPDDSSEVWYFKRQYTRTVYDPATGAANTEPEICWYPALGYEPTETTIGGAPVMKQSPMLHVKVGGLAKWKFGMSEVYAALDWAKAFTMFLTSWAAVQESLRRIAMQVKTPGGSKAQTRIKSQVGDSTLATSAGQGETNPPPNTGSWWIGGPGQELIPIASKNATTAPDEARQIKLQVSAATLTPEHFFGDPSTSNLATSKTLDRPTELKFTLRQELWRQVIDTIATYAMTRSKAAPNGRLKEALQERKASTEEMKAKPIVQTSFPPILEHDLTEWVGAVIDAATLKGQSLAGTIDVRSLAKMLLEEIPGIENVDQIVDELYPPETYDPQEWAARTPAEKQAEMEKAAQQQNNFGTAATKRQEALRILRDVIERGLSAAA